MSSKGFLSGQKEVHVHYEPKGLNDWRDDAHRIAREHGFKDATIPEDFALMHSEISEALEDYRDGKGVREVWYEQKVSIVPTSEDLIVGLPEGKATVAIRHKTMSSKDDLEYYKPCGIPSELADVIIRVLHFCGKHEIDIEQAVREKMLYNETRPFKHGGKKL